MRTSLTPMLTATAASGVQLGLCGFNVVGVVGSILVGGLAYMGADCLQTWWSNRQRAAKAGIVAEVTSHVAEDNRNKASFERGVLPCCGGTEFREGPGGGMSVNIECANEKCGQRWNVAFINGVCLMADRI